MKSIRLADPGVSSLFVMPREAWDAIGTRVSLVMLAKPAASTIAQYLPPFPGLVTLCEKWGSATYPSIVREARGLAAYATGALHDFESLQRKIKVSARDVLADARGALDRLATATRAQQSAFDAVTTEVVAFAKQNEAVDALVGRNIERMGPEWRSLSSESAALERASGLMRGGWNAIHDDLEAVASEKFDLTMEFILGLQIDSAIEAWKNINTRATAFAAMAVAA